MASLPAYQVKTNLFPSRSYPVPAPAVAAAPAVSGGVQALGAAFLTDVLKDFFSKGVKSGSKVATGAFGPPTTQGGSGSKYMITLQDVRDIEQYVNNENYKRSILGMEPLVAEDIIRERESQLRRSAAEAGAREYAIEQLKQQGTVQSALSQAVGQGTQSLGGVMQQGIASTLARPDYGTIVSELGRAF